MKLETGRAYLVTYKCRDIGSGTEKGHGEFIYRGLDGEVIDRHQFDPTDGGDPLYLFPDEITQLEKS